MPPEERRAVEAWAAEQEDKPTLSKAIRHLVALALAAEMKRPKRESAPVKRPRKPKP
jgi:hypothetical protein